MNLFLSSVMFSVKKVSFPAKTAVPAIHKMGNSPTTLCPRCKECYETHPLFLFHCKLSQTTLNFINELMNLNYTLFNPHSKYASKTF